MKKYFLILLLIIPAIAKANGDGGSFYMMDWYGAGGWSMLIYPLFWIIFIVVILALIVKGFARRNYQPPQEKTKSAIDILNERYATGEISKEKFEEMKKDIG